MEKKSKKIGIRDIFKKGCKIFAFKIKKTSEVEEKIADCIKKQNAILENKSIRIEVTAKQVERLSKIFKNGKDFQFKKVDYNSRKITREVDRIKKEQERIRKSGERPSDEVLRKIVFTI